MEECPVIEIPFTDHVGYIHRQYFHMMGNIHLEIEIHFQVGCVICIHLKWSKRETRV